MQKISYSILFLVLLGQSSLAQSVTGTVVMEDDHGHKESLIGVNVYWQDGSGGAVSDLEGKFKLDIPTNLPAQLIFSFVGFTNDTVAVERAQDLNLTQEMSSGVDLAAFEIVKAQSATSISVIDPYLNEKITGKELEKAACCNLSESFETNASVDVKFTDAVSGAKQIQMLGLDGVYTQMMFENMSFMRGLSAPYGLTYVPGTWVESMMITKGSGSVVNGYESITGQINVELQKPDASDRAFVNLYTNNKGRAEANVHLSTPLGKKWSTMLFLSGSDMSFSKAAKGHGTFDFGDDNSIIVKDIDVKVDLDLFSED